MKELAREFLNLSERLSRRSHFQQRCGMDKRGVAMATDGGRNIRVGDEMNMEYCGQFVSCKILGITRNWLGLRRYWVEYPTTSGKANVTRISGRRLMPNELQK